MSQKQMIMRVWLLSKFFDLGQALSLVVMLVGLLSFRLFLVTGSLAGALIRLALLVVVVLLNSKPMDFWLTKLTVVTLCLILT